MNNMKIGEKPFQDLIPIYLDTSAINRLSDMLSPEDAFATRKLISQRKKVWCMSPINLQEIFSTKDEARREAIICRMSQFYPRPTAFVDSPTRILFHDILNYQTEVSKAEGLMIEAWFDISRDSRRTFLLNYNEFYKRNKIKMNLYNELRSILKSDKTEEQRVKETKSFLVTVIFCAGIIDFDNSFVESFWSFKKQETIPDRYSYINRHHPEIYDSDQINLMTDFILWHSKTSKGVDRGLFHDAVSLIYSWTCVFYITHDKEIYAFSKINPFLKDRVLFMSDENIDRIDVSLEISEYLP